MPKITIDDKGIVEELPLHPTSLTIRHFSNENNAVLLATSGGLLATSSMAAATRFQYSEHGGGSQLASGSIYNVVEIDGVQDYFDGGLSVWNTGSNVFYPEEPNSIWTLRFAGQIEPAGGNPVFHLDFVISGSDPDQVVGFRHHQSVEQLVRNTPDHIHIQGVFIVFADQDLFVSGGQFKMWSDGPELTLISASLLIKEG